MIVGTNTKIIKKNTKNQSLLGTCKSLILLNKLVAGVGFEPTTFRL